MPGRTTISEKGHEHYTYVRPTRDNGCPVWLDNREARMRVFLVEGKIQGAIQLPETLEFVGRRLSMSRKKRMTHISGDWETKSNTSPATIWVFSYPVTATRRERHRVFESLMGWLDTNKVGYTPKHVESLVVGGPRIAGQWALEQKHRAILTKGNPTDK